MAMLVMCSTHAVAETNNVNRTARRLEEVVADDGVVETLAAYRHAPIAQHSMYTTTNNELGIKKPTNATFSNERAARSQNFSNSFNGVKHRNQGLNCAMTKSGAHKNLDPQWI